jgi:hypothetical protein
MPALESTDYSARAKSLQSEPTPCRARRESRGSRVHQARLHDSAHHGVRNLITQGNYPHITIQIPTIDSAVPMRMRRLTRSLSKMIDSGRAKRGEVETRTAALAAPA